MQILQASNLTNESNMNLTNVKSLEFNRNHALKYHTIFLKWKKLVFFYFSAFLVFTGTFSNSYDFISTKICIELQNTKSVIKRIVDIEISVASSLKDRIDTVT